MDRLYTFEMTDDQIDKIVIDELMLAHDLNSQFNTDEGGYPIPNDVELLTAIECVLEYFMPPTEYLKWREEVGLERNDAQ